MFTLIAANWWVFLLALLIGLLTAWWVWGRLPDLDAGYDHDTDSDGSLLGGIGGAVSGAAAAGMAGLGKVGDVVGDAAGAAVDGVKTAGSAVADAAGDAVDGAANLAGKAVDGVSNLASGAVDAAGAGVAAVGGAAAAGASAVAGTVDSAGEKLGLMGDAKPKIAAAVGDPDNLELIKGVGPKLNALLISLGVTRFDQIAAWGASDIAEVDAYLGNFRGRVDRDNWVDQASYLARGDHAGFEAKYGALGSDLD